MGSVSIALSAMKKEDEQSTFLLIFIYKRSCNAPQIVDLGSSKSW